ncbi:Gfo/Idh/MocA family protein [Lonepinella sp. BR2474]|uniref:Gfo/Idh/MocA family protein n=1 Tax=Lonepinella sp. BR2474 TaxID=3434548 RepID=UPI003F6DADBE
MQGLKVALVGCGFFGQQLVLAFQKAGANLVGMVDLDMVLARQLAERCQSQCYEQLEQLLAEQKPDLTLIATYNNTHVDIAKTALQAKSAVFIETPFTLTKQDCTELIALAKQQQSGLFVGHLLRIMPGLQKAKMILEKHQLGKLTVARANRQRWIDSGETQNWWKNDVNLTGGKLLHEIHELDLLCWLLGDVSSVYAQATNQAHLDFPANHDIIQVLLQFENGIYGSLEMGTAYRLHKWDIAIHGELGSLVINFTTSTVTLTSAQGHRQQFNLFDEFEADLSLREHSKGVQKYNQISTSCPYWLTRATEIEADYIVQNFALNKANMLSVNPHKAVCVAVAAKESIRQGRQIQVKYE